MRQSLAHPPGRLRYLHELRLFEVRVTNSAARDSFYARAVLPWLIHLAMKNKEIARRRPGVVEAARGRVLEIGIGSGLNLPHYRGVTCVVGIDPSLKLLTFARSLARNTAFPVELVADSAEDLPFPDATFDTVLSTCTLCSIPDLARALGEARRVLKPGGRFIFLEHGRSPDPGVARWQDRLTPLWRHVSGGCHLNRKIDAALGDAGFTIESLRNEYAKGPRPMTYLYIGTALSA
jgi:SAM-dependent methyltransferase